MVSVKKKIIGSKAYYYLEHAVRTKRGIQTREKYLGVKIPSKIEELKIQFLSEIYKERWYPVLN